MTEGSIPNNPAQDLEAARQRGRWLSDEEQAELDRQNQRIQLSQEQDRSRRRRLTVLTAVCVLLPPLWPVAFGLSFYLLFPQTAARIGLVAGVVLLLGGLALAVALALVTLGPVSDTHLTLPTTPNV